MFERIYIEKNCIENEIAKNILKKFTSKTKIIIDDYKQIFNRKNQNFLAQKSCLNLIIAEKKSNFIYPLSKFCENYDEENIYYASTILNCIYDCEYCFLSGMYNSSNIVIFVNLDKLEEEIKHLPNNAYICVSYDSDMLALNGITNFLDFFYEAIKKYNVTIEIRTKSTYLIKNYPPLDNLILSYTLTPDFIKNNYEIQTPNLNLRLEAINYHLKKGFRVQIAFEPLIFIKNYVEIYNDMLSKISLKLDLLQIDKFSIGTFRISKDFYKNMLKNNPNSRILNYPFINCSNMLLYKKETENMLINIIYEYLLSVKIPQKRIFIWN